MTISKRNLFIICGTTILLILTATYFFTKKINTTICHDDLISSKFEKSDECNLACSLNDGLSCYASGQHMDHIIDNSEDYSRVPEYVEKAEQFYQKAYDLLTSECNSSDGQSCYYLTLTLDKNIKATISYDEANSKKTMLLSKSCYLNYGIGCSAIGEYAKACELDEPWGCYTLAYLYYDGDVAVAQNIFQDRNKALELFKKSCDLGYARGCITLAFDIDRRNAGTYLAKGCNKFHDKACCINLNTWGLGE